MLHFEKEAKEHLAYSIRDLYKLYQTIKSIQTTDCSVAKYLNFTWLMRETDPHLQKTTSRLEMKKGSQKVDSPNGT